MLLSKLWEFAILLAKLWEQAMLLSKLLWEHAIYTALHFNQNENSHRVKTAPRGMQIPQIEVWLSHFSRPSRIHSGSHASHSFTHTFYHFGQRVKQLPGPSLPKTDGTV